MPVTDRKQAAALPDFLSHSGGRGSPGSRHAAADAETRGSLPDVWLEPGMPAERRSHLRLEVRWPAILRQGQGAPVTAQVLNISASGLYCCSVHPVFPGEPATVAIRLPDELDAERRSLCLLCSVVAARTEVVGNGPTYGIAFRISDYSLKQQWDEVLGSEPAE
jgi:hypothetical protein